MNLTDKEIPKLYKKIKKLHGTYLKDFKVKLPNLENKENFTKDALVLCLLFKYIKQPISKEKITQIIRQWDPNINDMQQARHLARQKGFYIVSGMRGDNSEIKLEKDEYCLITLKKPYPGYSGIIGHRSAKGGKNFDEIKKNYLFRCATCGSKENEANYLNSSVITKLQKGHINPNFPLTEENIIPQCGECNRAYRDWFIFDGNGRVTDLNINSKRWQNKYREI